MTIKKSSSTSPQKAKAKPAATPKKKTPPKKKSLPVVQDVVPKHLKKVDDGSFVDIRTPLPEKQKELKLRYNVS